MNIIWRKPDGGIATTHLTSEAGTPEEHAILLKQRGDIPADWECVATKHPIEDADRDFRNAWTWDSENETITIDKGQAVEHTKARLRVERKPLLDTLDIEFMKALELNNTNEMERIKAEKQRLRDVTKKANNSLSIETLKQLNCEPEIVVEQPEPTADVYPPEYKG
jgi:hypothetical protein